MAGQLQSSSNGLGDRQYGEVPLAQWDSAHAATRTQATIVTTILTSRGDLLRGGELSASRHLGPICEQRRPHKREGTQAVDAQCAHRQPLAQQASLGRGHGAHTGR